MKNHLTVLRLFATLFIFVCTAVGWFILGGALSYRSTMSSARLDGGVADNWGAPIRQTHPTAWYISPSGEGGRCTVRPQSSDIEVRLDYEPLRKGLL